MYRCKMCPCTRDDCKCEFEAPRLQYLASNLVLKFVVRSSEQEPFAKTDDDGLALQKDNRTNITLFINYYLLLIDKIYNIYNTHTTPIIITFFN